MKISTVVKHALLILLVLTAYPLSAASEQGNLKIAMLHLELKYADLDHNAQLIEAGIELAAEQGADWVMTPELALTGYRFDLKIGTDWIPLGPDQYVQRMQRLAKKHETVVFLSHLERVSTERASTERVIPEHVSTDFENSNEETDLFNTLFVIDRSGEIIGRHRKINTIPIAESWSSAGDKPTVVTVDQQQVGLLICADAWPTTHAQRLKEQGATMILSSASWAPGEYGPADTWEKRSLETGLPLIVNNRTGLERQFDLRKSVSAVSYRGKRLVSHQSPESRVLFIEFNTQENSLLNYYAHKIQ